LCVPFLDNVANVHDKLVLFFCDHIRVRDSRENVVGNSKPSNVFVVLNPIRIFIDKLANGFNQVRDVGGGWDGVDKLG